MNVSTSQKQSFPVVLPVQTLIFVLGVKQVFAAIDPSLKLSQTFVTEFHL